MVTETKNRLEPAPCSYRGTCSCCSLSWNSRNCCMKPRFGLTIDRALQGERASESADPAATQAIKYSRAVRLHLFQCCSDGQVLSVHQPCDSNGARATTPASSPLHIGGLARIALPRARHVPHAALAVNQYVGIIVDRSLDKVEALSKVARNVGLVRVEQRTHELRDGRR